MTDDAAPDPAVVRTRDDLGRELKRLYRASGLSYADIVRASATTPGGVPLPKSTVSDLVNGKSLPTTVVLHTFLMVCRVDADRVAGWMAARNRILAGDTGRPGRTSVTDADPRALGVHAAIRVEGTTDPLPPYVARDVDDRLRPALRTARTDGAFVLLVGGSSVGKTRCAYEAVRAVLPDWTLFQPSSLADLDRWADEPAEQTVVWLDEIQRFIAAGLDASLVRKSSRARRPVVIIGTLWPERYLTYVALTSHSTEDDPYQREREVLRLADVLDMDGGLSEGELHRARQLASTDERIRIALDSGSGLTQTLAAGPELVRRWENAPSPYAHALISAAVDARRLGILQPTPALLAAAVPGYLSGTARARAPGDWLAEATDYAVTEVHGAAAPLSPVGRDMGRTDGYVVADYLLHHALRALSRRVPPDSLWEACRDHLTAEADLMAAASAAYDRALPDRAEELFRAAVRGGSADALYCLVSLLSERGRKDEVPDAWALGVEHGVPRAGERLALLLEEHGRAAAAEKVWREAIANGDCGALEHLVNLLIRNDRLDDALECATGSEATATSGTWHRLAVALDGAGRPAEAADAWTRAQDHPAAIVSRASLLHRAGETDRAVDELRVASAGGSWQARAALVEMLDEVGRTDDAVAVLREAVAEGEYDARRRLSDFLVRHDRGHDAVTCWHEALSSPDSDEREHGWQALKALLPNLGDVDGLEALLRQGCAEGRIDAYPALEDFLADRGRHDQALETCRAAIAAGDARARSRLCRMLRDVGRLDDALVAARDAVRAGARMSLDWLAGLDDAVDAAEQLWREAAERGDGNARARLAERLREQGRNDEAVATWQAGFEAGEVSARHGLVEILQHLGRADEAVDVLAGCVAAGTEEARGALIKLLVRAGRTDEAIRHLRVAADAGDRTAWEKLAALQLDLGRVDDAVATWRDAVDANVESARDRLAHLLLAHDRTGELEEMWRTAMRAGVPGSRRRLADLLVDTGRTHEAVQVWREAVNLGRPGARVELARLLYRQGRVEDCVHELRSAVTAGEPFARHELYVVLRAENRHEQAATMMRDGFGAPGRTAPDTAGPVAPRPRRPEAGGAVRAGPASSGTRAGPPVGSVAWGHEP